MSRLLAVFFIALQLFAYEAPESGVRLGLQSLYRQVLAQVRPARQEHLSEGDTRVFAALEKLSGPFSQAVTGEWVARQVQDRDTGRDARVEMRMRLVDRHGRARARALTLWSLDASAVKTAPAGDRRLIRFTHPGDIRGTSFLVWEHPGAENERFLYLPALGRVRRIAGAEAQESFVGSDFTYEDIGGREFDDYTYTLVDEDAVWIAPDGARHPAYRLESRHRASGARFPRIVSLVRKDNFVVVEAEIFNRRNERQKLYEVHRLDRVSGIWTAMDMVMANEPDRTRTELVVEKAEYNVGLTDAQFSRRELERGGP